MARRMKRFFLSLFCACFMHGIAIADDFIAPRPQILEPYATTLHEKGTEFGLAQEYAHLSKNNGHKHVSTLSLHHHGKRYGFYGELGRVHFHERAFQYKAGFAFSMTDKVSAKLEVGSSTKNQNICPEKMGAISLEAHTPNRKMMFIPLLERKIYRNGVKTYLMALDSVYYSEPRNDEGCYLATQLHLKNTSPTLTRFRSTGVGLGTSYVHPKKYTLEIYGEVGSTYYENLDTNQRDFSYYLIRPAIDIHLKDNVLLLLLATYQRTKFYDLQEFRASLKFRLDGRS